MRKNKQFSFLRLSLLFILIFTLVLSLASCGFIKKIFNKGDDSADSNMNSNPTDTGTSDVVDSSKPTDSNVDSSNPSDSDGASTKTEFTLTFIQDGYEPYVYVVQKGSDFFDLPVLNSVRGYDVKWQNVDLTNIRKDITVYAEVTPKQYAITYVIDNGTNSSSNPPSYTVESGEIQLYAPTNNDGYEFYGWYTTPDFKTDTKISSLTECYYKDITLYACWYQYELEAIDGFTASEATFSGNVASALTELDFDLAAIISPNCYLKVYSDESCINEYDGNVVPLSIGENKVYVIVTFNGSESYNKYEVIINRLDLMECTFESAGEIIHTEQIQEGDYINLPQITPTKGGYQFQCWLVDGKQVSFPYQINEDTVFVARFISETYTITYHLNGGANNRQNEESYDVNSEFPLYNATKENYYFKGWYTTSDFEDGTRLDRIEKGSYGNLDLYAYFTPESYNIYYYVDGGENSNPYNYNIETEVIFNEPVKAGYTFKGWYSDEHFTSPMNKIPSGSIGDVYVYAKWEANKNILYLHANNGTDEFVTMQFATGSQTALKENAFTYAGYTFSGWAVNVGGIKVYNDKAVYLMGTDSEYHLYAVWTPNQNTLSFNGNGATGGQMPNMLINTNATVHLNQNAFIREGYTFIGWSTTSGGSVAYEDGASYTMGPNSSYTLYAIWEKNPYTITYVLGGNNVVNPNSDLVEYDYFTEYEFKDATRYGYKFLGWYTDAGYENQITKLDKTEGNLTLYAKWEATIFYITYTLNKGTQNPLNVKTEYTANDLPITLYAPSRTGYDNGEWYTENGLGKPIKEITIDNIGNYDLYACYYNISYKENGTGYTITNYSGTHKAFVIPAEYNGLPVTEIGQEAFSYSVSLQKLTMPETITYIYRSAFYGCSSLNSVHISDIEKWCKIIFVAQNSNPLYNKCDLYLNGALVTDLVIPSTVNRIESFAFYNCTSLTSIYVPSTVEYLGGNIFAGCTNLTAINFQASQSASALWHTDWSKNTSATIVWSYKRK